MILILVPESGEFLGHVALKPSEKKQKQALDPSDQKERGRTRRCITEDGGQKVWLDRYFKTKKKKKFAGEGGGGVDLEKQEREGETTLGSFRDNQDRGDRDQRIIISH